MKLKHTIILLLLSATSIFAKNNYFVNDINGNDTNEGTSWSKAFKTIQAALDKAASNDEIYVAAGTYYPTKKMAETTSNNQPTSDRTRSLVIPKGVKLYGGFPSGATDATGMAQRNWEANPTFLSGDFNEDDNDFDNMDENAYHVLVLINADESTVIDGFTISGGNANGSEFVYVNQVGINSSNGGGIHAVYYESSETGSLKSSPSLKNIVIENNKAANYGAGFYNYTHMGEANPTIENAIIRNNKVGYIEGENYYGQGAGIYNNAVTKASPVLTNVIISGNDAESMGGGFLCYSERNICAPVLTNVLISGNNAYDAGGMICYSLDNVTPVLTNVTIVGNKADDEGGGLTCYSITGRNGIAAPEIQNSVIWGNKAEKGPNIYTIGATGSNPVTQYSLIEGEPANSSAGNLNGSLNPEFASAVEADFAPTTAGNYQLNRNSPLINKGKNEFITLNEDLIGRERIVDSRVDIGAYEYPELGGGTSNEDLLIENSRVWANPGNLYVKIDTPTTIRVYTVDGTLYRQITRASEGTEIISLSTGIYFISLNDDEAKAKIFVPHQ